MGVSGAMARDSVGRADRTTLVERPCGGVGSAGRLSVNEPMMLRERAEVGVA